MSRKLGTQVNKRHDRAIDLAPTFDETPADFDDTPLEALAALAARSSPWSGAPTTRTA